VAATPAPVAEDHSPITSRLIAHPKLGRIVTRFVAQLPDKLGEMAAAVQQADAEALAALAHWLKGAGGSMGYDDLFEPAKALEDAAHGADFTRAAALLDHLHSLSRRIAAGLPDLAPATP
jgi:HPt (histidine-containing phosphotransfer) domain-containing protein